MVFGFPRALWIAFMKLSYFGFVTLVHDEI